MNGEAIPAQDLRLEIIHGGDAAGHQRRVQEWLAASEVKVVQIFHSCFSEPNSRTGVGFSTCVIFRED